MKKGSEGSSAERSRPAIRQRSTVPSGRARDAVGDRQRRAGSATASRSSVRTHQPSRRGRSPPATQLPNPLRGGLGVVDDGDQLEVGAPRAERSRSRSRGPGAGRPRPTLARGAASTCLAAASRSDDRDQDVVELRSPQRLAARWAGRCAGRRCPSLRATSPGASSRSRSRRRRLRARPAPRRRRALGARRSCGRAPARCGRSAGRRAGSAGRSSRTRASPSGRTSRAGRRSPRAPRRGRGS